jgi:hypothetical protein
MKCLVCSSNCELYFSKTYTERPIDGFMRDIGPVDYHKCTHCGFVLSETHRNLGEREWSELNHRFHHYIEDPESSNAINQPPYAEQAMMLKMLGKTGLINTDTMLDYAAGYGTLSGILCKYFNLEMPIFDPYIKDEGSSRYVAREDLGTYKTVINSAMFEHVLERAHLDELFNLVDSDGCLIIHTVVCENVPKDPEWFYLRPPVHTAFHTNKSMNILMEQWGFKSSIYSPPAKSWVLLTEEVAAVEGQVAALNEELQAKWFYSKAGFMDYWKGF